MRGYKIKSLTRRTRRPHFSQPKDAEDYHYSITAAVMKVGCRGSYP